MRGNRRLDIVFVAAVALIAGVGRLVQHFTTGEVVPNPPPVIVFVLAAVGGASVLAYFLIDELRSRLRG
jgi:hypothetical protein